MADLEERQILQKRFLEIMRRHVRAEDRELSDEDFIWSVIARWEAHLASALIDPAE